MSAFDIPKESILVNTASEDAPIVTKRMPALSITTPSVKQAWKISRRVSTTKSTDCMIAVCDYTGIVINVEVPAIPNKALEYTSPFANFSNAQGMVYQGEKYLQKLDTQILAGLFITCYKHYNLVHTQVHNGILMNAMLRTAGKQTLIDALVFSEHLSGHRANKCPRISLDYDTYKDSNLFPAVIYEYIKTLRDVLYPPANRRIDDSDDIDTAIRKRARRSASETEYENKLATYKKEAKEILSVIIANDYISAPMVALLKQIISKRNLVTMGNELRDKVVSKLLARDIEELTSLANIIKNSKECNTVLNIDNIESALDRASDHFNTNQVPKKSLAQILAEKKNKQNSVVEESVNTSGSEF